MSNADKNAALGESYGAANNRLKKNILFKLMQQLELDVCFQCGEKIDDVAHLSIEHKEPWLSAPDPKAAFFDLNNIAFSHLSCNAGAASKEWQTSKTHCPKGHPYKPGKRKCSPCNQGTRLTDGNRLARYEYIKAYRRKNPAKFREYERRRGRVK